MPYMPLSLADDCFRSLQITYDVLPLAAFLALVAVVVGCYMFYAGNKVRIIGFHHPSRTDQSQIVLCDRTYLCFPEVTELVMWTGRSHTGVCPLKDDIVGEARGNLFDPNDKSGSPSYATHVFSVRAMARIATFRVGQSHPKASYCGALLCPCSRSARVHVRLICLYRLYYGLKSYLKEQLT